MLSLSLAALLAALCVVGAALPFLREPEPATDALDLLTEAQRRRLELEEERDRALAALKELERDHRAGRISDDDYRAVVGILRADAARVLRAQDGLERESDADIEPDGADALSKPPAGQSDPAAKLP